MPGSGKTVFTVGLLRLFRRRGLKVQPYKCGPDTFDSQLHTLAGNKESVNLDVWLTSKSYVQQTYNSYGEHADVCLVDGNSGLLDGFNGMDGSSAELSGVLQIPVVLLLNARTLGYSAAALLYGVKHFSNNVKTIGVIFNHVSSAAHLACLAKACQDVGIDCLGAIPTLPDIHFPSRHSSLTTGVKQELELQIDRVADCLELHVQVQKIIGLCHRIFPCPITLPYSSESDCNLFRSASSKLRIAIAKDPSFPFVNRDNLERLKEFGVLRYFSPVYGSNLPECDLLYLPDGYPELFARQLHRRRKLLDEIRCYVEAGGKVLAEGGGMAFLCESIVLKKETTYEFCGVLPLQVKVEEQRLVQGYRKFCLPEREIKAHEFRFFSFQSTGQFEQADMNTWVAKNVHGAETSSLLVRYKNVIASTSRLYWGNENVMEWWNDNR